MSDLILDVVRPFKYGGREYERGDEWAPEGGAWDEELIKQQRYVKTRDPMAEKYKAARVAVANSRMGREDPAWVQSLGMTMEALREMEDEELLAIKGIGPARLKEIRS